MQKTLFLSILLCFTFSFCRAQIFGGSPPSVKWEQINTDAFRIIFPQGVDSIASRVAEVITFTGAPALPGIGTKVRKVDIVLRNKGILSNGYVGLAPFRSEFYLTPPADPFALGSAAWADLLSVHEYRHIQQYTNFNVGLSRLMGKVFGEGGQALANAASVPDWFFEGDAVYTETQLTPQGRGDIPGFYNGFRALWAADKKYSWMKLRNGSYLDFVPDRYILGFMLTAYGNEQYGPRFWRQVTHDAASFKSLFYPFQEALKKYSGVSYQEFRADAFNHFREAWDDVLDDQPKPAYYQNEQFPVYDSDGGLLVLKSSVKSVPQFVWRKDGEEKRIRTADQMTDDYFSYRNGRIVYAARRYHPRWGDVAWNEIRVIDVASKKQRRITVKSRYFSPDISDSGDTIVAVMPATGGASSLHMISAESGALLQRFAHKDVQRFIHPKFYQGKVISAVADAGGRMSVAAIDMQKSEMQLLLPFSNRIMGHPFVRQDTLFFSASQEKNDVLFALILRDGSLWEVIPASGGIGRYHPAVGEGGVAWSSFTAQGLRVQELSRNQITFHEVSLQSYLSSAGRSGVTAVRADEEPNRDSVFSSEPYRQLSHPFNFHSLIPNVADPEYELSLIGENVLNTLASEVSFLYNRADRSKRAGVSLLYGGLFPVLSAGLDYSFDRRVLVDSQFVYYNTFEPYAGFQIPLNLSSNRSLRSLSFGSSLRHSYRTVQKAYKDLVEDRGFSYLNSFVSFSNSSQQASAQVLPRFAQSAYVNYRTPLGRVSGYQYLLRARLFLPGIAATHSLNFTGAYSQKDTLRQIGFSNSFPFSRGYEALNLHRMWGGQVNYQLPVLYPEAGVANIAYLLRLRTNFFYDHTFTIGYTNRHQRFERVFRSAGAELYFDTKWWNQIFVSFGVRYSRLMDQDVVDAHRTDRWEFILPVNLFSR